MTEPNKVKHLELIQGVVTRLSEHSFRLKTFGLIQVLGAMVAFVSGKGTAPIFFVPIVASLVIWWLDALFLRDERAYRCLYDGVRKLKDVDIDFSMDVASMKGSVREAAISPTLCLFSCLGRSIDHGGSVQMPGMNRAEMEEIFLSYDFGRDAHRAFAVKSAWLAQGGVVHLESSKADTETEIKRWIDNRIESASVTVVLVGSRTHRSRWVEYEIRQTERSGKPLLGVDVSGIRDGSGKTTTCGAKLPVGYPFYDWVADQGERNLAEWVRHARRGLLAPQ